MDAAVRNAGLRCGALLFQDPARIAQADAILDEHLTAALAVITELLPGVNVYVSGSIARGEPSLRYSGGELVGLESDVDFVLIGELSRGDLKSTERVLNQQFTEWADTLYAFAPDQPRRLRSASARDLALGMRQPLCEQFPVDPPPVVLGRGHALELLAYQVVPLLVQREADRPASAKPTQNGLWQRQSVYARHKLAMEALRSATIAMQNTGPPALTFAAVYAHRAELSRVVGSSERRLCELLAARESWTGEGIAWSVELGELVLGAVRALAGGGGDAAGALRRLAARLLNENHPLHAYALGALVAFLRCFECFDSAELRSLEVEVRARLLGTAVWHAPLDESLAATVTALRWEYVRDMMWLKDSGTPIWESDAIYPD